MLVSDGLLVDGPGWVAQAAGAFRCRRQTRRKSWPKRWWRPPRAAPHKTGQPRRHHRRRAPAGTVRVMQNFVAIRGRRGIHEARIFVRRRVPYADHHRCTGRQRQFRSASPRRCWPCPMTAQRSIRIGPGIYREKLVCEKTDITLRARARMPPGWCWTTAASSPHPDGRPTHTFRSYTAFFSGGELRVEDMTIENDAGPGSTGGQAVAAYVDSARARVPPGAGCWAIRIPCSAPRCPRRSGRRTASSARGSLAPRRARRPSITRTARSRGHRFHLWRADALFEQCTLRTVDNHLRHSYVTARLGCGRRAGLRVLELRFRLATARRARVSGPAVAAHRQDCRAGLPPWCPHRTGRLPRWNDRTDTGLAALCREPAAPARAQRAPGLGEAPSAAEAGRAAGPARRKLCRPGDQKQRNVNG